ncbi:MAG TPA: nucleotide sugar dehydrogenase [Gemmataceae bacterium]|jgi:UDPglucose 6-dehydrogenase
MHVVVYGLWHLGCVTAACLARAGHRVSGFDPDARVLDDLRRGQPPLHEPGLPELLASGLDSEHLSFPTDPTAALVDADILWVTFDTPVNEQDEADVDFVRARLEEIRTLLNPGTLVLLSSQVPVGFTRALGRDWSERGLHFAYSPENLRLGKAIEVFCNPERVILGIEDDWDRPRLTELFAPFCSRLEWMSLESAEMTKHALNAFLATSVTFINELARLCEEVGADAKEVERGLKSERRIGPRAYLSPGSAFAGGTLARDLRFLVRRGRDMRVETPLMQGVLASNDVHKNWLRERVAHLLAGVEKPVVAVLGLTYKPGTSTLRRSAAIELCRCLHEQGVRVRGHDPAVGSLPPELGETLELTAAPLEALDGAHVAVLATEWPSFRSLRPDDFSARMRQACVLDPNHFLADVLDGDSRIRYFATGKCADSSSRRCHGSSRPFGHHHGSEPGAGAGHRRPIRRVRGTCAAGGSRRGSTATGRG